MARDGEPEGMMRSSNRVAVEVDIGEGRIETLLYDPHSSETLQAQVSSFISQLQLPGQVLHPLIRRVEESLPSSDQYSASGAPFACAEASKEYVFDPANDAPVEAQQRHATSQIKPEKYVAHQPERLNLPEPLAGAEAPSQRFVCASRTKRKLFGRETLSSLFALHSHVDVL